jgi:DNA-binding GntR family transcriptional regulator
MHDSLSQVLEREVRARIVSGELPAGQRINEVHLARALEVSRTPLREALTRLTGEAFVEARPRLGFYVRPLSTGEVVQLYPIRGRLDPWALRLSGIPPQATLAELAAKNDQIAAAAGDPPRVVELDDQWHVRLLAGCPNQVLLELIRQMMWRTRRYEHLYFRDPAHVAGAVRTHAAILRALRRGDLDAACTKLEDNMSEASPALLRAIEHASTGDARGAR